MVVVAFSRAHSTARVSRGYTVLTHLHAGYTHGGFVHFAKSVVKRVAYGGDCDGGVRLMYFIVLVGNHRDAKILPSCKARKCTESV